MPVHTQYHSVWKPRMAIDIRIQGRVSAPGCARVPGGAKTQDWAFLSNEAARRIFCRYTYRRLAFAFTSKHFVNLYRYVMKVGGDGAGRISLRMAGGEEDEIEYTAAYSMDSTTGSKPNLHRVAPVEATTCVLVVSVYPSSMTHATAVSGGGRGVGGRGRRRVCPG